MCILAQAALQNLLGLGLDQSQGDLAWLWILHTDRAFLAMLGTGHWSQQVLCPP